MKEKVLEHFDKFVKSIQEEPVSDDLEEAAKRYATEGDEISGLYIIDEEVEAFKRGAQWQKDQMMAKTIDVTLYPNDNEIWVDVFEDLKGFDEGERAKIIILK